MADYGSRSAATLTLLELACALLRNIFRIGDFIGGFGRLGTFYPLNLNSLHHGMVALEPGCGHKASQQQPPNGAPSVQITMPV
jgi:hypothetical protein